MSRFNKSNITRGISYLKRNGIHEAIIKMSERLQRDNDEADYDRDFRAGIPSEEELCRQRAEVFDYSAKISILVPAYMTEETVFTKMLESVGNQTYGNWELVIADASKDDSRRHLVKDFCEKYSLKCHDQFGDIYDKVVYLHLKDNKGISENTNAALEAATGDFVALLDHDDIIEPNALYEYMREINQRTNAKHNSMSHPMKFMMAYCDEDKTDQDNTRFFDYHKKPDFDPILLRTNNYICHFLVVDAELARAVGGFRSEYDGAQDHDFILRCSEGIHRDQIVHIPKVLYHWRSSSASTAENPNAKLYAYDAGKRAVTAQLKRQGIKGSVIDTPHLGFYRVIYDKLDAIVSTIDIKTLNSMTDQQIMDMPGEYLMVLGGGVVPAGKDNTDIMLSCMRNEAVGAVTGKIIDKKNHVESAGYEKSLDGELIPKFKGLKSGYSGYLHRANLQQLVDGFSSDVVLIRKKAVATFKPEIKLVDGYSICYEPDAIYKRKNV